MKKLALALGLLATAAPADAGTAILPNLTAGYPNHFVDVLRGKEVWIEFTSAVGNQGPGDLKLVPTNAGEYTTAFQWIMDAAGNVVQRIAASMSYFHVEHDHFHMTGISIVEVRKGELTGPIISASQKITMCLIDWGRLDGGGLGPDKQFKYCYSQTNPQGISGGNYDQYHHSTQGQAFPIPPAEGLYYLKHTVNYNAPKLGGSGLYMRETNYADNVAWTEFKVYAEGGRMKAMETGRRGGLHAFDGSANR